MNTQILQYPTIWNIALSLYLIALEAYHYNSIAKNIKWWYVLELNIPLMLVFFFCVYIGYNTKLCVQYFFVNIINSK